MVSPTILCPVDFSEHSRRALQYAARLAEHFGAALTVLNVVDPLLVAAASIHQTDLTSDTQAALREMVAESVPDLKTRVHDVRILVFMGSPAPEILTAARDSGADLIVMGTHGLSGYRKLFVGSTTERVLRQTEIAVLAVPLGSEDVLVPVDRLAAGLSSILAPVDFSEESGQSARIAAGLAAAVKGQVVLVHAVPRAYAVGRWKEKAAEAEERAAAEAEERLAALASTLSATAPVRAVVRVGSPADVIADLAAAERPGLIVMGLRGAGRLTGPAAGTVSYRVLCSAPVPVLAIPGAKTPARLLATSPVPKTGA
jgi:nucleotide-binding universal stress UspA family protein